VPAALAVSGTAVGAPSGDPRVTGSATLEDIPLGTFSNGLLPGTVDDNRGVDLGGIGSDIYPAGHREDPAASGVPMLRKRLVVDLGQVEGVPGKIEGVARVDHDTLALINDNDFGMTDGPDAFDAQGRLVDSGSKTTVTYVRLPLGI
jgi:hypothetical protein